MDSSQEHVRSSLAETEKEKYRTFLDDQPDSYGRAPLKAVLTHPLKEIAGLLFDYDTGRFALEASRERLRRSPSERREGTARFHDTLSDYLFKREGPLAEVKPPYDEDFMGERSQKLDGLRTQVEQLYDHLVKRACRDEERDYHDILREANPSEKVLDQRMALTTYVSDSLGILHAHEAEDVEFAADVGSHMDMAIDYHAWRSERLFGDDSR